MVFLDSATALPRPAPFNSPLMNIWLLHVGEELPVDENPRLFRYGHLAEALADRGHYVLRWAPTFQHARKKQRFNWDALIEVRPGYHIQFVHTAGYNRNVSWGRFRSYQQLAKHFARLAPTHKRPDLIVSGVPSPQWCNAALEFAAPRSVPVVVDVRDLWPDIFLTAAPSFLRPAVRPLLSSLFAQSQSICQRAAAITAVSQSYLDWGLKNADRQATAADRVFTLGYQPHDLSDDQLALKTGWLRAAGVDPQKTIACFFGLFEKSYDLSTVLGAARALQVAGDDRLQFVICGQGSKQASVIREASELDNVVLPGWVDPATIAALMRLSRIGLAAYTPDALQSLPNKPFEYMAGRLAVVSSLPGELAQLLDQHRCGMTYRPGDSRALADCLAQLADNPAELRDLRNNAYQSFDTHYRSRSIVEQMAEHLESVPRMVRQSEVLAA